MGVIREIKQMQQAQLLLIYELHFIIISFAEINY
jgi:hypothetical protein